MMLTKRDNRIALGVCVFLCALTWLVFGQTLKHGFVSDDEPYVYKNEHITPGLTIRGIGWVLTHRHGANWHPLTSISHMLDCQLFGLKPGGHHFTNALLHAAAAVSLFLVLRSMTGALWRSAFVAALFAIHPLRVESVAWVAERKDVLSGLFFMLTLGAYVGYARKPSVGRYLLVAVLFALGLMAKPMLVTLPVVLLLLDYWPLGRFAPSATNNPASPRWWERQSIASRLLLEKIPLLALSIASSIATLIAQSQNIDVIDDVSLPWRVGNAFVTVFTYIFQLVWPTRLAVFYPHPKDHLSFLAIILSVLLFIAISAVALTLRRARPYLFTGWFWYLLMLAPIIGLVQVGWQGHADRYTYLPQIGLYLIAAWAVADFSVRWHLRREIIGTAAGIIIIVLAWQSWVQTSYWQDNKTLWRHTIAVTSGNATAHNNLGTALVREGRWLEAMAEFRKALEADPKITKANYNLALALEQDGQMEESIAHYKKELQIHPNPGAESRLGHVLLQTGRADEAVDHFRRLVNLRPKSANAYYGLAVALHHSGQLNEAIVYYEKVLEIKPDHQGAHQKLAEALRQAQSSEKRLDDK